MYESLVGVPAGEELSQVEDPCDNEPPSKKAKSDDSDYLHRIEDKVDVIVKKLAFLDDFRKVFDCIICKMPAHEPIVSVCCQRVVGCKLCVDRWCSNNPRCPLCSVTGRMKERFLLQRVDDLSALFRAVEGPAKSTSPPTIDIESDDSANDFEEFPPFNSS